MNDNKGLKLFIPYNWIWVYLATRFTNKQHLASCMWRCNRYTSGLHRNVEGAVNPSKPAITLGERWPPSGFIHISRVKLPRGTSTLGLSRSWSPLPLKYALLRRSTVLSPGWLKCACRRPARRSVPDRERLPRGSRVPHAPGETLAASLARTKSLDLPVRLRAPHSQPRHKLNTKRHGNQVQKAKSFIFTWSEYNVVYIGVYIYLDIFSLIIR